MAESKELIFKKLREKAATNAMAQDALEADKLIKGPLAESQAWALDNPDPHHDNPVLHAGDLGQRMLTPENRHEANKDYVKAAATEVAEGAALGGVGKAASFLPIARLKAVKEALEDAAYDRFASSAQRQARHNRMGAMASAKVPQKMKDKMTATFRREHPDHAFNHGWFGEVTDPDSYAYKHAVERGHVLDGKVYSAEFDSFPEKLVAELKALENAEYKKIKEK